MRRHNPDSFSLVVGLAAIVVGSVGLAGRLELRTLTTGWLLPAVVVVVGLGVITSAYRAR